MDFKWLYSLHENKLSINLFLELMAYFQIWIIPCLAVIFKDKPGSDILYNFKTYIRK